MLFVVPFSTDRVYEVGGSGSREGGGEDGEGIGPKDFDGVEGIIIEWRRSDKGFCFFCY